MKEFLKGFGQIFLSLVLVFSFLAGVGAVASMATEDVSAGSVLDGLTKLTVRDRSNLPDITIYGKNGAGDSFLGEDAQKYKTNGGKEKITNFKSGQEILRGVIYKVVQILKMLLGAISIAIIVYSGFMIVSAGDENAEEWTKQKKNIIWAVMGLVIVWLAEPMVQVVLKGGAMKGETLNLSAASASVNLLILDIIRAAQAIVTVIAILVIVILGTRMMFADDEGEASKYRKSVIYAIMGLVFIMLSRVIVSVFYAKVNADGKIVGESYGINVSTGATLVADLVQNIMGLAATACFGLIVYAGFRRLFGGLDEEGVTKANKIIIYAITGMMMALLAYVFTDFAVGKLGNITVV